MRTVNKLLTPFNFTDKNNVGRIKYIVIHYVGALGGAQANCKYYAGQYVGASAHYFVGFNGEIWQSVEDEDIAWHCGASSYKHAECRNSNSIGIELCVRKKNTKNLGATDKDCVFPLFCGSVLCNLWELPESADFLLTDIHFPDKIQQEVNKGLIKSG